MQENKKKKNLSIYAVNLIELTKNKQNYTKHRKQKKKNFLIAELLKIPQ